MMREAYNLTSDAQIELLLRVHWGSSADTLPKQTQSLTDVPIIARTLAAELDTLGLRLVAAPTPTQQPLAN